MASELAKPPYQRTAQEQATVEAFKAKRDSRPSLPKILVVWEADSKVKIDIDHPDPGVGIAILLEALGISTFSEYDALLNQIIDLTSKNGRPDQDGINKALAMMVGIGPKDATEAMLAVQMVAIHDATMTQAMRLKRSEMLHQMDSCSNSVNKLARTFTSQMEALKRYRTSGQQQVTVKHVTVNDGGQAIVGNVIKGGEGRS